MFLGTACNPLLWPEVVEAGEMYQRTRVQKRDNCFKPMESLQMEWWNDSKESGCVKVKGKVVPMLN
jgi:hypothetical protein